MVKTNIEINDYYMNIKHQSAKARKDKWHFRKYFFPVELDKHLSHSMKYRTGFIWNVLFSVIWEFQSERKKSLLATQRNIKPVT